MSLCILGTGWVTPHGRDLDIVAARIRSAEAPPLQSIENPFSHRTHPAYLVDRADLEDSERQRRLRRSSTISHLAVTAARDAMANAGLIAADPGRIALLFAATNGGVIYTRRFFAEIAERGTQAGSPLLFPETVYNAPASHIAATLGIEGTASTLVGDATAGISAIQFAEDLLATDQCDVAVVVAAEEADWITCEGYGFWNLATRTGVVTPFADTGLVFAEGAAAIVLARDSSRDTPTLRSTRSLTFTDRAHGVAQLGKLISSATTDLTPDRVITSANGTRLDHIEADALSAHLPDSPILSPKIALGESFTASAVAQIVHASREPGRSLITTVGTNHQLGILVVES